MAIQDRRGPGHPQSESAFNHRLQWPTAMVYFGCRDSNFYAVDEATGREKWKFNNKGSWVVGSPAVRDGKVYFATSDSSMLYKADAKSGRSRSSR